MVRNLKVKNVRIIGVIPSYAFQRAKYFLLELHRSMPLRFPMPEIEGILELQWYNRLTEWRRLYGSEMWRLRRPVAIFLDDKFIGSDIELLKLTSLGNVFVECVPPENSTLMKNIFREDYLINLKKNELIHCYFDISVDDNIIGTLVFQLYSNILPRTCENFTAFCLGTKGSFLSYKGSRIHRIVKNGWLQGGDIQYKTGGGGFSTYCSPLQDECYGISHDRRGVLSMANHGKHTNGSQFFITLNPTTWMDTYYVAFGQLIEGVNVLNFLENIDTFRECPLKKIEIKNCGKLDLEDVDDVDARYAEDLRDAAPKRPKKIEKIADQVARLVIEAVTECLEMKERIPDVVHVGDVPSGINLDLYFQGLYSLPEEVLEESAKYLRTFRRDLFRQLKPSATEVVEVITYDLLGAVFTKMVDLDDVRECAGHSVYAKLIDGIDMKLEMTEKPYIKKFVEQLVATAESMVKFIAKKLNWMRRNKLKTRVFQEQMNEWVESFVLQETFMDDNFRIAERSSHEPSKRVESKLGLCCDHKNKSEEIWCCGRKMGGDIQLTLSQFFSSCRYDLKKGKRDNEGRISILDLIESGRYRLRILRHQEQRRRSKARACLEKRISQWMKDVAYVSETKWIRQTVFAEEDVCLNHTEEIMYGAMTIGLLEMYFLMEEDLKRPKRKKYRTRVIYPEGDDSFTEVVPLPGDSSCSSDAEENLTSPSQKSKKPQRESFGQVDATSVAKHKPCACGDICCDCTSESGVEEDELAVDLVKDSVTDQQVVVPPTPPPSLEASIVSSEGKEAVPEYLEANSCSESTEEIQIEEFLARMTGESADKINLKSFKWMQDYILNSGCRLKSEFAGQVHSWLDSEIFTYPGFLSKHSLVTRASLLSLSFSLASLLKEENCLKSEIRDFVFDLWELYFRQMFKEAFAEYPPESEVLEEFVAEPEVEEKELVTQAAEDEIERLNNLNEPCSNVKTDFDFDKFCSENAKVDGDEESKIAPEPQLQVPTETEAPKRDESLAGEDHILDEVKSSEAVEQGYEATPPKKWKSPVVIRELIKSSEEIRSSTQYTLPFWVKFLAETTKRALGLISKLSRLPRRLYFTSDSETSFDDKMKSWIEFNNFSLATTAVKDVKDFITEHHVSLENLDESARSFLRKKTVWELIERSSRSTSAEVLAEEVVLDLVMKVFETVEGGEDENKKLSQGIYELLIASATANTAELPGDDGYDQEATDTRRSVENTEMPE